LLVLVHHVYFYIKKRKNMTFIKILLEPFWHICKKIIL
jgi:hypothetical protein